MEYQALRRYIRLVDSSEGDSMAARVAAAINEELTPRQRQLVGLYYSQQLTMTEIGRRQGLAVSTVSRTLKRARARLKRALRYGGRALLESLED